MQLAQTSKRFHQIIPRATTYDSRALGTIIPVLCLRSVIDGLLPRLSSSSLLGTTTAAVPTPTGRCVVAWGLFCDCVDLVLLQCMSSVIASVAARLNNNEGKYGLLRRFQQLVQQLIRHHIGRGRLSQLVHQLQQLRLRDRSVLPQYQHASMMDYHEFQFRLGVRSTYDEYTEFMEQIKNGLQIEGITSLDFCFSTTSTTTPSNNYKEILVFKTLSHLFPSLREVDLTLTLANRYAVYWFFTNCSRLEKMTFHINERKGVSWNVFANGVDMVTAHNLKELHMDDSIFYVVRKREIAAMSDLDNTNTYAGEGSNVFLFYKCSSTVLERVSLRNSGLYVAGNNKTIIAIPQTALMKFIRNAPITLRWFRSNLTTENINILQRERPEIEFVS